MADSYYDAIANEKRAMAYRERIDRLEADLAKAQEALKEASSSHLPTGVRVGLSDGSTRTYTDCDWYRDYDLVQIRDTKSGVTVASNAPIFVERWGK